jgi:hypothetical protein
MKSNRASPSHSGTVWARKDVATWELQLDVNGQVNMIVLQSNLSAFLERLASLPSVEEERSLACIHQSRPIPVAR